jgi:hypothetical protein
MSDINELISLIGEAQHLRKIIEEEQQKITNG